MRSYADVFKAQTVDTAVKHGRQQRSEQSHIEVRSEYYGPFVKEESAHGAPTSQNAQLQIKEWQRARSFLTELLPTELSPGETNQMTGK